MRRTFFPLMLIAALWALDGLAASARGVEPVEEFLEALWQHRYYDEAIDYLDALSANTSLDESLRMHVGYEQGRTLLESAGQIRDPKARDEQLTKAAQRFEQFSQRHPDHALAASAKSQLGTILVERGRADMHAPGDKQAAAAAARRRYEEARKIFAAAETQLTAQSEKFPKLLPPGETQLQNQKRQVAAELIHVRILRASVDYDLAKTFAAGSPEAEKYLAAAAKSYAGLYESNRTRAAGLLARLWEGRCYQELGRLKQALGCYQELMELPAAPDTRSIKNSSTRHAMECWTTDSEKNYQAAIERGERWEREAGSAASDADAMAIRYLTALACQGQSDLLSDKDPNRKRLVGSARQYVGPVAEHPGEFQRPARMLLVALDAKRDRKEKERERSRPSRAKAKEPADDGVSAFIEPYERARQALQLMEEAGEQLKDPKIARDKAKLAALGKQKAEQAKLAKAALEEAIAAATAKTPVEDLNEARWYLCYLAWDAGDYYDAAVLGDFLARRYPESARARMGARIALASYVQLYSDSKAADKSFEDEQIHRTAELIFQKWAGQEEADIAALTLLNFAAALHQFDKVQQYLDKIPAESPRRGPAELRTGQTLWSAYLRELQAGESSRRPQAELDRLKEQAEKTLTDGVARTEKTKQIDAQLATAELTLAQIYLESGEPDKAIARLEEPTFGPLSLIVAKNPVAAREQFASETYRMALRAYIAVNPQQVEKAEGVMNALDKLVQASGDAKAAENLTAIYISLGRELQQHVQSLSKSGKTRELEAVSKAFETFLDRVTKRDTGTSLATLNWVGETYYNLGLGFDEAALALRPKAATYFSKAATAYEKMLTAAEKDEKYKDQPAKLIPMRLRLADCYRRGGKYDEAIKVLLVVLRQQPSLLNAQVQAAETYQTEGATEPANYAFAIKGSTPGKDGANMIWGWSQLSKVAENNYAKFADTFHLARLQHGRIALSLRAGDQRPQADQGGYGTGQEGPLVHFSTASRPGRRRIGRAATTPCSAKSKRAWATRKSGWKNSRSATPRSRNKRPTKHRRAPSRSNDEENARSASSRYRGRFGVARAGPRPRQTAAGGIVERPRDRVADRAETRVGIDDQSLPGQRS